MITAWKLRKLEQEYEDYDDIPSSRIECHGQCLLICFCNPYLFLRLLGRVSLVGIGYGVGIRRTHQLKSNLNELTTTKSGHLIGIYLCGDCRSEC